MLPDIEKIKKESEELKSVVWEKTIGYIIAALSLVAGLAWSDTLKAIIEALFPFGKESIWLMILYAVVITLIVVLASFYLTRAINKEQKNK
jgi:hydrogenase-4 membrane subunit HyfE